MEGSKPVSSFFEPGTPPPTLPIPTAHVDLRPIPPRSLTITSHEDLASESPHPTRSQDTSFTCHGRRPYFKKTPAVKLAQKQAQKPDDDGDLSESSSSNSDAANEKISKPEGEAGRPGRGGYNLGEALGWHPKSFKKLKNLVQALVTNHLDSTKSYSSQGSHLIRIIMNSASQDFPELDLYEDCWPVTDLIKMHLKYTSCRAKLMELRQIAGKNAMKSAASAH